jgi:hypothetical protein
LQARPNYTYEPDQSKNILRLVNGIRNDTHRASIAYYLEAFLINGMLHFCNANYPGPPYNQNFSTDGLVQKVPSMVLWGEEDP